MERTCKGCQKLIDLKHYDNTLFACSLSVKPQTYSQYHIKSSVVQTHYTGNYSLCRVKLKDTCMHWEAVK